MSRIKEKAVAYAASNNIHHYRDLTQAELEAFWSEVDHLRHTKPWAKQAIPRAGTFAWDSDQDLHDRFWLDQKQGRP